VEQVAQSVQILIQSNQSLAIECEVEGHVVNEALALECRIIIVLNLSKTTSTYICNVDCTILIKQTESNLHYS
jgi:hypothetical protein